jgi:hypothetical protein
LQTTASSDHQVPNFLAHWQFLGEWAWLVRWGGRRRYVFTNRAIWYREGNGPSNFFTMQCNSQKKTW